MHPTSIKHIAFQNDSFDYLSNYKAYLSAANMLSHEKSLNRFSVTLLLEALLSINAKKVVDSDIKITQLATKLLEQTEYHNKEKVFAFQTYVLAKYAEINDKYLRDAYHDFLRFGVFDTLQRHYFIQHTQGLHYISSFVRGRIDGLQDIWNNNGFHIDDNEYITLLSKACTQDDVIPRRNEKNSTDDTGREISRCLTKDFHDQNITNEVASLFVINKKFADISFQETMSYIDFSLVEKERSEQLYFLIETFIDFRRRFPSLRISRWIDRGLGMGILFYLAQTRTKAAMIEGNDFLAKVILQDEESA